MYVYDLFPHMNMYLDGLHWMAPSWLLWSRHKKVRDTPEKTGRLASPPSGVVGAGSLPSRAGGFGESPRTQWQRVPGRLVHHGSLATLCGDALGRSEQRCDGPVCQSKVMGEDLSGGTLVLPLVVNRTGLMHATPSHTFASSRFEPVAWRFSCRHPKL